MSKKHVVVVGAGVIGSATAIEALRGDFQVTLIDAEIPGGLQAASYGNAGCLSSHSVIPPAFPGLIFKVPGYLIDPLGPLSLRWQYLPQTMPWLCRYILAGLTWEKVSKIAVALRPLLKGSPDLHKILAREAGVPHLIEQKGMLSVFSSREHFVANQQGWIIRRQLGIEWKDMEGQALQDEEPDLSAAFRFAVLIGEAGSCRNPGAYTKALAQHAINSGAAFRQTTVTGLHLEAGRVKGVYTRSGEIPCDKVVVALGASSRLLAVQTGDCVSLKTERGYHLEISGVSVGPRRTMMINEHKVVVSPMENALRIAGQVEIAPIDARPNWERADLLLPILRKIFPELPTDIPQENITKWMGCRPSTPDGLPCLGFSSMSCDVVHSFGHGHVGLVASARTGRLVCQLLGEKEPEIDIRPFAPNRFNLL
jgi:D-amino-acid dehydrogenase